MIRKHAYNVVVTALLVLASGTAFIQAQNTSPLDTAPGVNGTSSKPASGMAATAPLTTPTGPSLLSNGDFQAATKDPSWPDDWGKGKGLSWQAENGKHFLRIVSEAPGGMFMAYREMPVPPGTKGLEISVRYRTANVKPGAQSWFDARAIFHVLDASKKQLKPDPKPIVFSKSAANWMEGKTRFVLPPGATTLVLMPSLFQVASGTLDLAEVHVSAMSSADADTMAAAAQAKAKVDVEHAAIIAKEVNMPPRTPELKVNGNKLVTAGGKTVWLQGVNVCSLEWSPEGNNPLWSMHVAVDDWRANVIRLPVMNTFWFGRGKGAVSSNNQEAYRKMVDDAIKLAAGKGIYVVLDLHRFFTPDESCVEFWKDAAARYKNNPAVLFDIFNEPHGTTWDVWQSGGPVSMKKKDGTTETVQGVGMQALVDAVRGTGAKNIIIAGGLEFAYNLTGVLDGHALDDKGGNGIMYATHFYNWHKGWEKHFLPVAEKYPILVGECGCSVNKMSFIPAAAQEDPYTWAPDAIGLIQKYHLNWTAWSFHTSASPVLLQNWDYAPTPYWGEFVKEALAGKQFEMKKLR